MSRAEAKVRKDGRPQSSGKRKRNDADAGTDENSTTPVPKKPTTDRPEQVDYDEALSHMDSAILADHLAKHLKRHATTSSSLELDDKYIPAKAIRDTSLFSKPRVAVNLTAYLEEYAGGKEQLSSCDQVASPHTVVVTSSGIRAADLTRSLRVFATDNNKIAKLFAKHMKLQSNIDFMKKTKVGIGVGTPTRLRELVENGAVQAAAIKRIVIDASYVDEKKRTIFDSKDIYLPMIDLLNIPAIKERMGRKEAGLEILVF